MNRPKITIELESLPHAVPVTIRLRRLLKMMLRSFGFKAVVTQLPAGDHANDSISPRRGYAQHRPGENPPGSTSRETHPGRPVGIVTPSNGIGVDGSGKREDSR
jgi:hypothetical protein